MPGKGLGRGLDSLIPPDFYDEDFDSNSPQSLEDMLSDIEDKSEEEVSPVEEEKSSEPKNIFEEIEEENAQKDDSDTDTSEEVPEEVPDEIQEEEVEEEDGTSEDISGDLHAEDNVQTSQKIQVDPTHVDEVKEIVNKNPRITLWSSRSSAVLRYLRKTEPEFSISKEASSLIDEAISKKYPEIWELFEDF